MKLIRCGEVGQERPGIISDTGEYLDVSAFGQDYDEHFFRNDGINKLASWLQENRDHCPRIDQQQRLAAPICRPSKIVCVGLNYAKHAEEAGMKPPAEPVLFFKATTAIVGAFDNVRIPPGAEKVDWEVELAVVIGQQARHVNEDESLSKVAGYTILNDVSERHYQIDRGGQWVKGKSADTFAPMGPYLLSRDALPDPHALDLWLKVNDEIMQQGSTADFIFNIPFLVSYISQFMTLLPGDVISTGTPAGVGLGLDPPRFLRAGDKIELGITQLGSAEQHVVAAE